jgi:hypothetical protein
VGVNWDQIGVTREGDADYQGPQAIVSLEGGVTALLDNVNSRVLTVDANGEVSTLTDLPTNTFEALVQSPDGKDLVAIDTFTGTAMDVRSGNTQKLSPLLSTMPAGLGLSLGTDGTLYATSPADGTQYSVGQTGTPGLPAETTRRVEVPRAWIDGSTLHVQRNLTEKPLAVEVEPAGGVSILGLDRLSDGRVVVLLDTALKSTVQTQLVVIDGSNVGMVELDGVGAFLVGHPFSVQGTSASYASYDDRGLVITTLYL